MSELATVAREKQLIVMARVEPGSLGPDGMERVESFCRFANQRLSHSPVNHFSRWRVIPRYDKTLPEIEYFIADKKLNPLQVGKYLSCFQSNLDHFEEQFYLSLTDLIEQYLSTN